MNVGVLSAVGAFQYGKCDLCNIDNFPKMMFTIKPKDK